MPNKRFQLTQEDGALTRVRRKNLSAHPMSPMEAAKFAMQDPHRTVEARRGFTVDWGTPDFNKIDGDPYWEARRVLRQWSQATGN
jgi:hypothetical protein